MKHSAFISVFILAGIILLFGQAEAGKSPDIAAISNGFPSGAHYNLNILGKKAGFTCPSPEYDQAGNPAYGNAIFIPEDGSDIQIIMTSDKKSLTADIQVIDPCAAAFDGTPVVIQIPYSRIFNVYARPLGKPTNEPSMIVTPGLFSAVDEAGSDLLLLGTITTKGFQTPGMTFTRSKGKSKARDISGMFQWNGSLCELSADLCTPVEECMATTLCCTDANADLVYESCAPLPVEGVCAAGSTPVEAYCKEYLNEWVFNIAELVGYSWDIDNKGAKHLQIRFYPIAQ